jgi:SulP family sulfate permease
MVISTIDLLLNVKALADSGMQNIKINRELKSAGYSNVASFLAMPISISQPSFCYIGLTKLTTSAGAKSSHVAYIIAALFILVVFAGGNMLSLVPRLILGGLVGFIGLDFLYEWLYLGWKEQSRFDATIITVLLVVVEFFGLVHAVTLGLLVTGAIFIYNYSNIDVVRQEHDGSYFHSNVDRPSEHRRALNDFGHRIYVARLHGYIFFVSATRIEELIESRIHNHSAGQKPDFIIVDFLGVTGIDSSALHSFVKIRNAADAGNIKLVYSGMIPAITNVFASRSFLEGTPSPHSLVADLDTALKMCEDELLKSHGVSPECSHLTLDQLSPFYADPAFTNVILNFLEEITVPKGKILVREGSPVEQLYIVRSGVLEVQSYLKGIRFGEYGPGSLVGVAAILAENEDVHEASVVAKSISQVLVMSKAQLSELTSKHPLESLRFYQYLSGVVADRCIYSTRLLEDLLAAE